MIDSPINMVHRMHTHAPVTRKVAEYQNHNVNQPIDFNVTRVVIRNVLTNVVFCTEDIVDNLALFKIYSTRQLEDAYGITVNI